MDEHSPQAVNPEVQHEEHDVNVRALLMFGAAFVVVAIVIHVGIYFLYKGFAKRERARAEAPITLVQRPAQAQLPPEPRLQPFPERPPVWGGAQQRAVYQTPVHDMERLRAREEEILNSYGWADQRTGRVRIPIEQAMELTIQRGLPVRQPIEPQPAGATPPAQPVAAPPAPAGVPR